MKPPPRRRPARAAGFTLFEILVSIAIFMLLAGGIFGAVQAAFSASTQVASAQLDAERADAFQQLLRRFFLSLPGEAKVELRLRKQAGRGDVVELLAWPVPPFLRFGVDASDGIALTGLPDGRGNFRFSLGYFRADDPPEVRDRALEATTWLTLLPNVSEIRWRMAPARNPILSDSWNAVNGRPGLAELTLRLEGGESQTFTYWVPPVQRRASSGPEEAGGDEGAPPPAGVPAPAPGEDAAQNGGAP